MTDRQPGFDDKRFHLTLLAKNNQGYKNLVKLTTIANLEGFYYKPRLDHEALAKYSEGIIALSGCLSGEIPARSLEKTLSERKKLSKNTKKFSDRENFYLEINHCPKIKTAEEINQKLIEYSQKFRLGIVAACDVHYLEKRGREIPANTYVSANRRETRRRRRHDAGAR